MHRIDHPTNVEAKPAPLPQVRPGYFTRGDALTGQEATWVTADWANDIQENIAQVIEAALLELEKGNGGQLLAAIRMIASQVGMPIGIPFPWMGAVATIPANCVPVMGQSLQRTLYPVMAAHALGSGMIVSDADWLALPIHRTKFSAGDGIATFRLPDLRGEVIYAADLGRGVRSASIGDWLVDEIRSHAHSGATDQGGDHQHTGSTSYQGDHNHGNGIFTRLLRPPYEGSITGSDTVASGSEQAVGPGDSAEIVPAGGHLHSFSTDTAGRHAHTFTTSAYGGIETRQRGVGYPFIMRVK